MAPLTGIALDVLFQRSMLAAVTSHDLSRGLDNARRLDALEWLIANFEALNMPDPHAYAALTILDRFAASSLAPIPAGPDGFALVLASMILALKACGTEEEVDLFEPNCSVR